MIKEIPTTYRTYYKSMRSAIMSKVDEDEQRCENINKQIEELYSSIRNSQIDYVEKYNLDLNSYKEFGYNKYIDGTFLRAIRSILLNRKGKYEIGVELFDVHKLAKLQQDIHNINKDLKKYNKMLNLSLSDYNDIIKTFYEEVHRQLILNGNGYVFESMLGWICVNRCQLKNPKPKIDYAATKKNKQKLLAEGKLLYNKEEDDWCKRNGLEYKAEDYRVYRKDEYVYEIPLLGCQLPNGNDIKLNIAAYRSRAVRGKTNEDLLKECNNDVSLICSLPVDVKTKLTLCLQANKMLYLNFIRNENQKPIADAKVNRKNRQ